MDKKKVVRAVAFLVLTAVYAAAAAGLVYLLKTGENYPAGTDTMEHIYKGNVLYHSIQKGNWYPLYDSLWYNGVEMMRYCALLPTYLLAFCQMAAGGNDIKSYLVFVGIVFFIGAMIWLYIGFRKKRLILGAFLGVLWFFITNNLYTLFVEGDLTRTLALALLPLLIYLMQEYLFEDRWTAVIWMIPVLACIALCHVGFAGMTVLAMLLFLFFYRLIYRKKGKILPMCISLLLPFLLIGIWLFDMLPESLSAVGRSRLLAYYFQDALVSLNPVRRLTEGHVDVYFGLAAFLLAVFGLACSKKRSSIGFLTSLVLFAGTMSMMYPIFNVLPGGDYLWMLRFVSIALCLILFSFFVWNTLRRWLVLFCCVLLILDVVPSLSLIYKKDVYITAEQQMEQTAEDALLVKAGEITTQRAALLDESSLGSMVQYLLTDYDGKRVHGTFGAGWSSAATNSNIVQLNEAMEGGHYRYLFDRALELGNDTVLIQIEQLRNREEDIHEVTKCAKKRGYELVDSNTGFLLYHLDTYENFGTTCQYNGIGIGTMAPLLSLGDPDIEEGESANLNDYTLEELSQYKVIYLAGFTYEDKAAAEKMLCKLSDKGVRILINGDGIPINEESKNQEFLGVTCHGIQFENGYPLLYKDKKEVDCSLFDEKHKDWKTVYFTGLDQTRGYINDASRKLDFLGTVYNDNIYFIGLNLTYHYALTLDEGARQILADVTGTFLRELPDRKTVPLEVDYTDEKITIQSKKDGINTSIAYHDIFESSQSITTKRNLIYVNQGTTVITMKQPDLWKGLCISGLGVVLTVVFLFCMIRRERKSARTEKQENRNIEVQRDADSGL